MTKAITASTTFNSLAAGNQPASLLDASFAQFINAFADPTAFSNYVADTGVANAYLCTPAPAWTTYTGNPIIAVKILNANTAASTLNVSGLGAAAIKRQSGAALQSGDLKAGGIYVFIHDGTNFQLIGGGILPALVASTYLTNDGTNLSWASPLPALVASTYLTNDGTNLSWASVPGSSVTRSARTSNTILGVTDKAALIDITSGTFTQTFTAAATLGNGWYCWIRNSGTGDITLDPNASETIDGLTSFIMYGQEARLVACDGTSFYSIVVHPFYRKATSTFTFTMPPGYLEIEVDLVGGGGGGGAGRRGAAATVRAGGAPGGAPGRTVRKLRNLTAGGTTTLTIGAAGTGGAAQTVDDTNGADGTAGGNTTFGALATAYGGAAGKGGSASNVGTSGSGWAGAGSSTNAGANLLGGLPAVSGVFGSDTNAVGGTPNNIDGGGGGLKGSTGSGSGNTVWGGASSDGVDTTGTTPNNAGSSLFGVSAATAGGWITAANTLPAKAGNAGLNGTWVSGGGATGGTCGATPTAGTNGTAAATDDVCGNPGSGGGSTITGGQTGKPGGNGGLPGGPGGGGGAVLNGQNSGAGGNGANGQAIIKGVV